MRYILLFFLFLVGFGEYSQAQNAELLAVVEQELEGKWIGTLSQEGTNKKIAPTYVFELTLDVKGNQVTGYSYIEADGNYAKINLKGVRKGLKIEITEIKLSETKIVASSSKGHYDFCIKNLHLEFGYDKGRYCLKGAWDGKNESKTCTPGLIEVFKETIRA